MLCRQKNIWKDCTSPLSIRGLHDGEAAFHMKIHGTRFACGFCLTVLILFMFELIIMETDLDYLNAIYINV